MNGTASKKHLSIVSRIFLVIFCLTAAFKLNAYIERHKRLDAVLFASIGRSEIDTFQSVLQSGANANAIYHYNDFHNRYLLAQYDEELIDIAQEGQTPLFIVIKSSNDPMFQLLIDEGADLNFKDPDGFTPLMVSAMKISRTDSEAKIDRSIRKTLISRGADVNARSKDGLTPLKAALTNQNKDAIQQLRQAGARE